MKLRFLKTTGTLEYIEECYPKWLRIFPPFKEKSVSYTYNKTVLQYLENGKWIEVPIIEIDEIENLGVNE